MSKSRPDVILEIPAPCDWINANQRKHWHAKAALTKQWRAAAAWHARADRIRPYGGMQVRIVATIHKASSNRFDPLNWADTAKAAIDGLRDAGVLADDDWRHVIGPDMRAGEKRTQPTLVLRIEALA